MCVCVCMHIHACMGRLAMLKCLVQCALSAQNFWTSSASACLSQYALWVDIMSVGEPETKKVAFLLSLPKICES